MKKLLAILAICLVFTTGGFSDELSLVKNSTIKAGVGDMSVNLKNGKSNSEFLSCYVSAIDVVFGALNKKRIAVLVSDENGGGSGSFYFVRIMEKISNKYVQVSDNFELGDRIKYKKVYIRNNIVYVDFFDRDPNACMACPSIVHKILKLKLVNNKLVKI